MFLLILEDVQIYCKATVDGAYLAQADDGIMDIIDISGDTPLQYYDGKWNKIEEWKD